MVFCSQVVKSRASSLQTSRRETLLSLLITIAFHTPTVYQSANQFAEFGVLLSSVGGSLTSWRTDGQASTDVGRNVTLVALVSLLSETMPEHDTLLALSPSDFEKVVADVLRSMGYQAEVSGQPGDGGVDVRLKRGEERSVAQYKKYAGMVGQAEIRDSMGRCSMRIRSAATS